MSDDLGSFEGHPVRTTSIATSGINEKLTKALAADPRVIVSGEKLYAVVELDIGKIGFDPILDGTAWDRIHAAAAVNATFVPGSLVRKHLERQAALIVKARDEKTGASQLALTRRAPAKAAGAKKPAKVGGAKRGRS